jgi:hypothetical protein
MSTFIASPGNAMSCLTLPMPMSLGGFFVKGHLRVLGPQTRAQVPVKAIFDYPRGKAKRDKDTGEGASNRSKKNRNKQWHEDSLMAIAERKGKKVPTEGQLDHFEKLLEGPCRTLLTLSGTRIRTISS